MHRIPSRETIKQTLPNETLASAGGTFGFPAPQTPA